MITIQRGVSVPLTWKHCNEPAVLIAGTVNKCPTDVKSFMESWRAFLAPEFPLNPDLAESWFQKPPKIDESSKEFRALLVDMDKVTMIFPMPEAKEIIGDIVLDITYDASALRNLT